MKEDIHLMPRYILHNGRGASATVSFQGAQVLSWKTEHGEELLFTSKKFRNQGTQEQYGFAREKIWLYEKDPPPLLGDFSGKAFVDLLLKPQEEDRKVWPHSDVRVEGLDTLNYLDKLLQNQCFTEQGCSLSFESEVDRVYIETNNMVAVLDHQKRRTFVIRKDGLPDIVVWNPWKKKSKAIKDIGNEEYMHMLCVDSASVENPITLKPGQEWTGRLELSLLLSS
ncbi:hypothetical protein Fmac_001991 [Flemingia macrophylla]|uniref:Glucose-6-phosphate 1-epimerase n=1 Tax=Flemingia macrophylla TaxID=520843 RepID=A0ABD1NIT2_9FABA